MSEPNNSIFAPRSLRDVADRLARIANNPCDCGSSRHLDALHDLAADDVPWLIAEIERMRTVPAKLRIDGTWLVEEVDEHTCGGSDHIGHEPGCGSVPMVDLADLPGWRGPS